MSRENQAMNTSTETPRTSLEPIFTIPATSRHGTITVRPWQLSYADSLAASLNNRAIWLRLRDRVAHPYTLADAHWWIDHCSKPENWPNVLTFDEHGVETVGEKKVCSFAIVTQNPSTCQDEAIGSIGLLHGSDVARRSAELGYWLAESHWRMGIMGEVVPNFVEWAWDAFPGLVRVHSEVYASNEKSAGLLQKSGFDFEGRQRAAVWKDGKIDDTLAYARLRPRLNR